MKTALIDGDILVYRCGFAAEKTHYLVSSPDGLSTIYSAHKEIPKGTSKEYIWSRKEIEPVENALNALEASISYIMRQTGAEQYEIYLSGPNNFRNAIAVTKPYKGNREGQAKPVHYAALRRTLLETYNAQIPDDGLEADDLLGIRLGELGDSGVVVSIDKDLLQIPGRHYNWVTGDDVVIQPKDGHLYLGCQIISGDPTDNVPGLPGLGEAKARKLLGAAANPKDMLARIRAEYLRHAGGDESSAELYFREQGSLVYILKSRGDSFDAYLEKYS
jgi:hypothetical protein